MYDLSCSRPSYLYHNIKASKVHQRKEHTVVKMLIADMLEGETKGTSCTT